MTDSILSSLSETCENCEKYKAENKILRQRLTASHEVQKQLSILNKIKTKIQKIKQAASKSEIQMSDLAQGINFALDKMFAIKSYEIVKEGKDVIQMVLSLLELESKRQVNLRAQPSDKNLEQKIEIKPAKKDIEKKIEPRVNSLHKESFTQKIQRKQEVSINDRRNQFPTQKYAQSSILEEMNRFDKREEKEQNPYVHRDPTPVQNKGFKNADEEQQKLSMLNTSSSYEDICLPLIWEKRTFFDINNKVITKNFNDIYKKICTENPLPRLGKHKIKIQMVNNGTVAFGIVTQTFKNQYMISGKCDAVKYLSFGNGGGKVQYCGEYIMSGQRVHLRPGQVLEITFNADALEVAFKNPNLLKPLETKLDDRFRNKELYFFLEMKQFGTAVKMI